jgi:hypothetical protein
VTVPAVIDSDLVEDTSAGTTGQGGPVVSYSTGDRILLIIAADGSDETLTPSALAGGGTFAAVIDSDSDAQSDAHTMAMFYADAEGAAANDTLNYAIGSSEESSAAAYVLDAGTFDPETPPEAAVVGGTENINDPDPPSLTPSWDATDDDTLWGVAVSWDADTSLTEWSWTGGASAFPDGQLATSPASDGSAGLATAYSASDPNVDALNPGVFTNAMSSSEEVCAVTWAVRGSVEAGTPGSVTPDAIARAFAVNAATVKSAARTAPSAIARSITPNAATVKGGAVTNPGAVTRSFTIPAVTAFDSGAPGLVTPATVALSYILSAPTARGTVVVTPAVMNLAFTLPAVTVVGTAKTTPAAITLAVTIPQATAFDSGDAGAVTPDTIARAFALPTPTVAGAATAEPSTISRSMTVNAPTVRGGGQTTPGVIARSFTVNSATAKTSATTSPNEIARSFALHGVTVKGAAGPTPDSITVVVTIPSTSILIPAEYTWQEGGLTVIVQQGAASSNANQGAAVSSGTSGGVTVGGNQE